MNRNIEAELVAQYRRWQAWADSADQDEDGWQSSYPEWTELLNSAEQVMTLPSIAAETQQVLAACWAISAEAEELLDFAQDNVDECWPLIEQLVSIAEPACRWQLYVAAAAKGPSAEPLLRAGLLDEDGYARRRAILALAALRPSDAGELSAQLLSDADPYIRQTSLALAAAAAEPHWLASAQQTLLQDPIEHVRRAAARTTS